MPIIRYTEKELELLARLMRAEAIGEGNLGMLMVGNVIVVNLSLLKHKIFASHCKMVIFLSNLTFCYCVRFVRLI